MRFEINILGSSGAVPAYGRFPSMQLLDVQSRLYLIDCGEGAQLRFAEYGLSWAKLRQIFITHQHGDHLFGLPGLLSSMALNGRVQSLDLFGPAGVGEFWQAVAPSLGKLPFPVHFHTVDPSQYALIFEDKRLQVFSLPLKHRAPTSGYLFKERQRQPNMRPEQIAKYDIPYQAIPKIKAGEGYQSPQHGYLTHEALTLPPPLPRSFAYCSDTAYHEPLLPYIKGVDLLYHEATFTEQHREQAEKTMHTTARDAARMASASGAQQLLLGHFSARYTSLGPLLLEACELFPNTFLGVDGSVVPIPFRPA